jgi:L-seryl-tRNA(Ser) seleniumtransferase
MSEKQKDRGAWTRRDIVRVGGMATAAGMMGAMGPSDAAAASPSSPPAPAPAEPPSPEVYTRVGVRPFINLTGTYTINGGALTLPEVRDASGRAAAHAVDLDELMEKVGGRIAELLGSESAIVTCGAAAALTSATAACIAGADPELIQQLPDLTGLKDEVIIPKESRNVYDHAFRTLGVRMVEVDTLEAFQAALGHRTAMVAVLGTGEARGPLRLEQIAAAARQAGVPVIVDAAAELPLKPNPYLSRGADMVAYSGGKTLRGPQCAGLLLGRKDLVWAAFMNGAPHHAFGRMMKVAKEEIMGMLAAVEVFASRGIEPDYRKWRSWLQEISDQVTKVPGVKTQMQDPAGASPFPTMMIAWDPEKVAITAGAVYDQLMSGEPRIMSHAEGEGFSFRVRPPSIREGDALPAGRRIAEVLRGAPKQLTTKTVAAPAFEVSGRWEVDVKYSRGSARHRLTLVANGNRIDGTHLGRRLEGVLSGSVDGDKIRMRSSLPIQGTRLGYGFDGTIKGKTMEGTVSLGEYGSAQWTARRLEPRES